MAAQVLGKDCFTKRNAFELCDVGEIVSLKNFRRAFDNECRRVIIKLIGVRPNPSVLGLFKDEGERIVKFLMRSKPYEMVEAHVDFGFELVLI